MEYKEAVAEIGSAAAEAKEAKIDMSAVFKNALNIKELSYSDAIKELVAFGPMVAEQQAQQPQQPKPEAKPKPERVSPELRRSAASELRKIAAGIEEEVAEARERRMLEKLILPKLSLADQMSELEKIEIGIVDGSFSAEQLKLIREEVRGLSLYIKKESPERLSSDERELAEMRNKKTAEIKEKLGVR